MGEAGLEACAGFLVGGASACPLVGGVGPLVSRDVSRGGCGLRKPLGSLSTDGWDCVPTLLVVWPEASQHCSLQVVGWDQVLVLISQARCQPSDAYSWICLPPAFMF